MDQEHGLTHKPVILIIDDSAASLAVMSQLLQGEFKVQVATSGAKGLAIATSGRPPDLILLDIMMPLMDGHEVCRRLKSHPASRDIPVLFLTAQDEPDDERRGFEAGAVDYIAKPARPLILSARVRTQLRLKAAADFLRTAKEIAYSHQEKWDGSGYPQGLAGDAIPLSARLMALADVCDALISRRVYKEPMTHEQAAAILRQGRGSHFDPDVADAFCAIEDEFRAIAARYRDSDEDLARKHAQFS
jgi:response regulator RpfG family c-di-GMP phosphodiesterase